MTDPVTRTLPGVTAQNLAEGAEAALLDEIMLTPKPGLVDQRGRGAHLDMDLELMCRSARALRPAFQAMAEAALGRPADPVLRWDLGRIGREAESAMLSATGGVNTHRGAIWAMGLLVAAAAMDTRDLGSQALVRRAGLLARVPDEHAPSVATKGSKVCAHYQVPGARGEAQDDFPHLTYYGLPTLRQYRAEGAPEGICQLNALLAIMARLADTCVLSRGGQAALAAVRAGAAEVLAAGGAGAAPDRLSALEATLLAHNASPGGAADLLAATLFIDRLERTSAK